MDIVGLGAIGRKVGMTRVFVEDGQSIPVTVLEVSPNVVTRVKSLESDGYQAVQVTTGEKHKKRLNKPDAGQFAKAEVEPGRGLWEFRLDDVKADSLNEVKAGAEIKVNIFKTGQKVDVTALSKGKGFAGAVKRHNFKTQDNTHGNSLSHRAPGSIGQNQSPGKVFKGKKMAGQLGNKQVTIQSLEVVRVDEDRNLLLIKGAVPGSKGGDVRISPAIKHNHTGE